MLRLQSFLLSDSIQHPLWSSAVATFRVDTGYRGGEAIFSSTIYFPLLSFFPLHSTPSSLFLLVIRVLPNKFRENSPESSPFFSGKPMGTTQSPGAGSANSGQYSPESAETLRFEEEIQSLVAVPPCFDSPPASESSFTALLGLPPNQAVELLHDADPPRPPVSYSAASSAGGDIWRLPLPCSPIFPSNSALVERASRFSVFASEESTELFAPGSASVDPSPKIEPADSGDRTGLQILAQRQRSTGKRKDGGKSKAKCAAKKSRSDEENITGGDDKLSYVHVRARRGQATDSHSLAERARREKINARMKLLQELVPGCNKISGTALVLDEIINHVQSLQRQVEFLSMRLAAVNPSIDFSDLDSILSGECVQLMVSDGRGAVGPEQPAWSAEGTSNGDRQLWHGDVVHQQWERDERSRSHQQNIFIGQPGSPLFTNYGSNGSVSLPSQLKTEP